MRHKILATTLALLAMSSSRGTASEVVCHVLESPGQSAPTTVRVLLPDNLSPDERIPAVYVLPVEAGLTTRWGDSLQQVMDHNLHNRFRVACVFPEFADLPWYVDHPERDDLQQESYLLQDVIPLVERRHPVQASADSRRLVGFSKSGWGAWSLLLRHPDVFACAAAFDAPLAMDGPGRYGSGPLFGNESQFREYQITRLLKSRAAELRDQAARLFLLGDGNFAADHAAVLGLTASLQIPVIEDSGTAREHSWHSGWLATAFGMVCRNRHGFHTPPADSHPLMTGQEMVDIPLLLPLNAGPEMASAATWTQHRRPELLAEWSRILGKLEPAESDRRWFGDVTQATELSRTDCDGYVRIELTLPLEVDFDQPHLLLIPKGIPPGRCPAVIAWTSTSPDYREPEVWWGSWLAQHGYVVLTGWSLIRNYRNGTDYRNGVHDALYERFGRWSPMGRMVYDVQREAEFLRSLEIVDGSRIGFMGFSLSAKSALYVAAFAPEIRATVSIDPHLSLYGHSNYLDPWYLDARRPFPDITTASYPDQTLRHTVWSLLDADPSRPGFEHNHHELLALAAPRALQIIGCSTHRFTSAHSDDWQSRAYVERAREVFELLNVPDRLEYVSLTCGHEADAPEINAAWQAFFERWLKEGAEIDVMK